MDRKDEIEFDLSKIMQEFTAQAPPAPLTGSQPAQQQMQEEEAPPVSVQEARERAEQFFEGMPRSSWQENGPPAEETAGTDLGDTIRLDQIQKAPMRLPLPHLPPLG